MQQPPYTSDLLQPQAVFTKPTAPLAMAPLAMEKAKLFYRMSTLIWSKFKLLRVDKVTFRAFDQPNVDIPPSNFREHTIWYELARYPDGKGNGYIMLHEHTMRFLLLILQPGTAFTNAFEAVSTSTHSNSAEQNFYVSHPLMDLDLLFSTHDTVLQEMVQLHQATTTFVQTEAKKLDLQSPAESTVLVKNLVASLLQSAALCRYQQNQPSRTDFSGLPPPTTDGESDQQFAQYGIIPVNPAQFGIHGESHYCQVVGESQKYEAMRQTFITMKALTATLKCSSCYNPSLYADVAPNLVGIIDTYLQSNIFVTSRPDLSSEQVYDCPSFGMYGTYVLSGQVTLGFEPRRLSDDTKIHEELVTHLANPETMKGLYEIALQGDGDYPASTHFPWQIKGSAYHFRDNARFIVPADFVPNLDSVFSHHYQGAFSRPLPGAWDSKTVTFSPTTLGQACNFWTSYAHAFCSFLELTDPVTNLTRDLYLNVIPENARAPLMFLQQMNKALNLDDETLEALSNGMSQRKWFDGSNQSLFHVQNGMRVGQLFLKKIFDDIEGLGGSEELITEVKKMLSTFEAQAIPKLARSLGMLSSTNWEGMFPTAPTRTFEEKDRTSGAMQHPLGTYTDDSEDESVTPFTWSS